MAPRTHYPSDREQRISASLRDRSVAQIQQIGSIEKVASLLDAPPIGVESLLAKDAWDLTTAFRVAEALGIDVTEAMEEAATA